MSSKQPLKVLWLQSSTQVGGTEMMLFNHWRHISNPELCVTNCFLYEPGPISELYHQLGTDPVHLFFRKRSMRTVWQSLRDVLCSLPFDIVHIFGLKANLIGRLASHLYTNARVVTGQRSVDDWRKPWHVWADRLTSRWVDLYICNSLAGMTRLQTRERIPPHKTITIHNGLDVKPFDEAPVGVIRRELRISSHAPVMTTVGNLREPKAHDVLIEACRLVRKQGFDFHLLLVGDGKMRPMLERLVTEAALSQQVHFLGRRLDIPAILADSDLKVLSSRWEGLPGAIMEAMAARLPVVATDVGGIPELVKHGHTGLLCRPGDPMSLASGIIQLLGDSRLRRQMGAAGYEQIVSQFRLEDKAAQWTAVYRTLAGQRFDRGG